MSVDELISQTDATGLAELVRKGDVAPAELVEATIARAEALNPQINAIVERLYDRAREQAASVDLTLPFAGVPIALKDLGLSLKGTPIHSGSAIPARTAEVNSRIVEDYLSAGFIPVATSMTPELGLRLVTESERFGITRNPWDTSRTTGGSSGGAAALVAAGIVPVAHASDGGGSIRVPSACCGLVGMKPSRGRVPFSPGAVEPWHGFAVQNAITRSVRDSARMLDLVSSPDPLSLYAAPAPKGTFAQAAASRQKGMRIALYRETPLGLPVSDETWAALDEAARLARDCGHTVEEIALPMLTRDFFADYARVIGTSVAGELREHAERCGRSVDGDVERHVRVLGRLGEILSAGEVYETLQRLHGLSMQILAASDAYDAVLMPLIAEEPVVCGSMDPKGPDLVAQRMLDRLHLTRLLRLRPLFDKLLDQSFGFTHWPAIQNATGQPSIALPVHVTANGLPLGIQAVGRIGGEEALYALAGQMEEASGWLNRRAPLAMSS